MFGVQTLDDGAALLADLDHVQPRRAVMVGGGYIGVEMAEVLVRHGVAVTVVDHAAQPMTTLDPDMGEAVHRAMEGIGIDVHADTAVVEFETGSDRRIRSVVTAGGSIPADVVVLSGLAGLALAGCQCLLRAAVNPHRPSEPCPDFFESYCFSWSPVTESNRRPSPYHACRFRLMPSHRV